ncbi:MAG: hypothetical protein K940chlam1_00440 [Candidatus Anoxychlamydiales bacterium]|nr:hypothetical protein [Candidatus Anoxychlamydiales bacterium]NGX35745.1 hypothetical protein [Candidatus Anoxychlamydiales bacterium]
MHLLLKGLAICSDDLPKGYLAPARIDVCGSKDYTILSFIYWEPLSNQLDLGTANLNNVNQFKVVRTKSSSDFKPGFKVGFGKYFSYDDWELYTQYTFLHMTKRSSFDPSSFFGEFYTSWFFLNSNYDLPTITSNIDNTWKMHLDKIDLELARPFYVGSKVIFRPYLGGSLHFFDQKYGLSLTTVSMQFVSIKSISWALGPRFGLNMQYFLPKNFRIFGNGAINLMYSSNKTKGLGSEQINDYNLIDDKKYILRDVQEIIIGFGWGKYSAKKNWYYDLILAYEAQKYSQTNFMSRYAQTFSVEVAGNVSTVLVKPGDLFLHGLTTSFRLDF